MTNVLGIIIAAVAAMVFGAAWYSPALFGKQWMNMMGFKQKDMKKMKSGMGKAYFFMFVAVIVQAAVLNFLITGLAIGDAVVTAIILWLGFIGTVTLGSILWEGKPFSLWILNNAYNVINMIIMALILTAFV